MSKILCDERLQQIKSRLELATEPHPIRDPNNSDIEFFSFAKKDMKDLLDMIDVISEKNTKLEFYNQQLQSLDGLQQMSIDKLNEEVARLRESIYLLEDQNRRNMAVNITS
jgi:hypothetical protein